MIHKDRQSIFKAFGGSGELDPNEILNVHYRLLGSNPNSSISLSQIPFEIGSAMFWLVWSDSTELDDEVKLDGHQLAKPEEEMQDFFYKALLLAQQLPDEMAIISRYSPCYGYLKLVNKADKPITSCSLPDFPLISFFSEVATRHIPPTSVIENGSEVLLAENLFHEAVHQMVNYMILTNGLLSKDFNSSTSPMVDIPWRVDSKGRPAQWQVDRVLHAASVYTKLLGWRTKILQITGDSPTARLIAEANQQALISGSKLLEALDTHREILSERGLKYLQDLKLEFDSNKNGLEKSCV